MKSTVEPLEGNKIKLSVELDEAEFEKDLDAAFRRLAREVKLPGFRPGKAPRKVLEARIGQEHARGEAFREALPNYYSAAVIEHEVDVIAPPEIDITGGEESGQVFFEAIVEVRPSIDVSGYEALEVTIPNPTITEDDIDESVDRMRRQFSELETVDRPAEDGDQVVIDIEATQGGEPIPGMTTEAYNYEVGSGSTGIDEFDENLRGATADSTLTFEAEHPDEDEDEALAFVIKVSEVQERVLPEATDEWVAENSEFETVEELRADYRSKLTNSRLEQARTARQNNLGEALAALVDDEHVPPAMVENEAENQLQDMAMRLQSQGMELQQYLQFTGQDPASLLETMRTQAATSTKIDLAMRSIAAQENITVDEDEFDSELADAADQMGRSVEDLKAELATAGRLPSVRVDLMKTRVLDWLIERAKLVDEDGQPVDAELLQMPDEPDEGDEAAAQADDSPNEED